jgi:hypothetical protein
VLSCPGVTLDPLVKRSGISSGGIGRVDASLQAETAAVFAAMSRLTESDFRRASSRWTRAVRDAAGGATGRSGDRVAAIRSRLGATPPMPSADDLASVPIPSEADGLDRLPLFFDEQFGRVALSSTEDRVDVLALVAMA